MSRNPAPADPLEDEPRPATLATVLRWDDDGINLLVQPVRVASRPGRLGPADLQRAGPPVWVKKPRGRTPPPGSTLVIYRERDRWRVE